MTPASPSRPPPSAAKLAKPAGRRLLPLAAAVAVAVAAAALVAPRWLAPPPAPLDATVFDNTPLPGMYVGGGANAPRARGVPAWPARVRVERGTLKPAKPGALEVALQVGVGFGVWGLG